MGNILKVRFKCPCGGSLLVEGENNYEIKDYVVHLIELHVKCTEYKNGETKNHKPCLERLSEQAQESNRTKSE